MLSHVVPPVRLSPEGELRLLQDAQQRARTKLLVVAGSIAAGAILLFAAFAGALWVFMRFPAGVRASLGPSSSLSRPSVTDCFAAS